MTDAEPYILDETEEFAVVFKPSRIHCAPLRQGETGTLLHWYADVFPPVMEITGRKAGEGGLLHRLDFETQGLVLFAKNNHSLQFLAALQNEGKFIKEYSALCGKADTPASFPPLPARADFSGAFTIASFFRPFGPGRKQVRPVTDTGGGEIIRHETAKDQGGYYRTEIANVINTARNGYYAVTVRLKRGFRHQIRCHLAWTGFPILNDPVYGEQPADGGFLALRGTGLFFTDPVGGGLREYRIPPLEIPLNSL